jgi:hypothetical protein
VSRKTGRTAFFSGFCIFFAFSVLLASGAGCLWGRSSKGPPSPLPGDEEAHYTRIEPGEEAAAARMPEASEPAAEGPPAGAAGMPDALEDAEPGQAVPESPAPPLPGEGTATAPGPAEPHPGTSVEEALPAASGEGRAQDRNATPGKTARSMPGPAAAATPAPGKAFPGPPTDVPAWAAGREVLVYRIEFLGMTMGYARFTFKGKVTMQGRETYHLNVRAWTSDFLSVIYPINDSIDYYLDVKTLAPLRQEFTHQEGKKDDVAIYDQVNGMIVYRFKETGKIRKQVAAPPDTYDPVSVAYYFRTWDLGEEERPRHVYAGRKLYQISTKLLRQERIDTSRGTIGTIVIQPVIRRDGQLENKGDLRMWMTNDARHVPVRIYAKFRKIRDWTLQAELLPPREGG